MMICHFLIIIDITLIGIIMDDLVINKIMGYMPSHVYQITYKQMGCGWHVETIKVTTLLFTNIENLNVNIKNFISKYHYGQTVVVPYYDGITDLTYTFQFNDDSYMSIEVEKKNIHSKSTDIPIFDL